MSSTQTFDTRAAYNNAEQKRLHHILLAHGLLLGIAACVIFPFGAMLVKLCRFRGGVWVHAVWQMLGLMAAIAGFGTGVYLSNRWHKWQAYNGHTIFGTVIIGFWVLQPLSGLIHHAFFRKGLKTTSYGVGHRWIGRIAVVAGIVNGGLGIQLHDHTLQTNSKIEKLVYAIVAGVFGLLWVLTLIWSEMRSRRVQEITSINLSNLDVRSSMRRQTSESIYTEDELKLHQSWYRRLSY